jgi:hypothetical protein
MAEKALTAVIQEILCPKDLDPLSGPMVKAMCIEGISKSQVSRLCAEIDERVQTFLHRLLEQWGTRGHKLKSLASTAGVRNHISGYYTGILLAVSH